MGFDPANALATPPRLSGRGLAGPGARESRGGLRLTQHSDRRATEHWAGLFGS